MENELPNGFGKATYADGRVYEGNFVDGYRSGKGKMTFSDKTVYEGDYVRDKAEGQGEMRYPAGERFTGEWKNDNLHGFGVYYDSKGKELYRGQWKSGEPVTSP